VIAVVSRAEAVAYFAVSPSLYFRTGRNRLAGRVAQFGRQDRGFPPTHLDRLMVIIPGLFRRI
jgi:hypothetical protein